MILALVAVLLPIVDLDLMPLTGLLILAALHPPRTREKELTRSGT